MSEIKYPLDPQVRLPARKRTLCEVLREIYRAAELRGDLETMAKANEAHDYGKRMSLKLEEYKAAQSGE